MENDKDMVKGYGDISEEKIILDVKKNLYALFQAYIEKCMMNDK